MGRKGRVHKGGDNGGAGKGSVSRGMLGILQFHCGREVNISFRADAMVSDEGVTVRQRGILVPDPSGAKDSFALISEMEPQQPQEPGIIGQAPEALLMVSFTPDVVAVISAIVPRDALPNLSEDMQGLIAGGGAEGPPEA